MKISIRITKLQRISKRSCGLLANTQRRPTRKAKFEVHRFVSRVIKAKSGRKKRHKKVKEIAMKKKAAKAAKAR